MVAERCCSGTSFRCALFKVVQVSTFGEDHRVEKRRLVVTMSNTRWEERGASQDVKMNGTIGVSSLVYQVRPCLITDACG